MGRGQARIVEIWVKLDLEGSPPEGVAIREPSSTDAPEAISFVGFLGLLHALSTLMSRGRHQSDSSRARSARG
jgi:hypothetical protein